LVPCFLGFQFDVATAFWSNFLTSGRTQRKKNLGQKQNFWIPPGTPLPGSTAHTRGEEKRRGWLTQGGAAVPAWGQGGGGGPAAHGRAPQRGPEGVPGKSDADGQGKVGGWRQAGGGKRVAVAPPEGGGEERAAKKGCPASGGEGGGSASQLPPHGRGGLPRERGQGREERLPAPAPRPRPGAEGSGKGAGSRLHGQGGPQAPRGERHGVGGPRAELGAALRRERAKVAALLLDEDVPAKERSALAACPEQKREDWGILLGFRFVSPGNSEDSA